MGVLAVSTVIGLNVIGVDGAELWDSQPTETEKSQKSLERGGRKKGEKAFYCNAGLIRSRFGGGAFSRMQTWSALWLFGG